MFQRILCALDGSSHAEKALKLATDLASRYEAKLLVLHVLLRNLNAEELQRFAEVEGLTKSLAPEVKRLQTVDSRVEIGRAYDVPGISSRTLAEIGQILLDGAKVDAGAAKVQAFMQDGDPAKCILECAEREGADCIVMGSRGLSNVASVFLGSVSHKVSNRYTGTCITVS